MLEVKNLSAFYGNIEALRAIDLWARAGRITTIIGANGAGKTTLLTGDLGPDTHPLRGDPLCRSGHHQPGAPPHREDGDMPRSGGAPGVRHHERGGEPRARCVPALTPPTERRYAATSPSYTTSSRCWERGEGQSAGTLSGGEQQMLAIGRALMSKPAHAAAGRTLHGSRPPGDKGHLLLPEAPARGGIDHPPGRAGCSDSPAASPIMDTSCAPARCAWKANSQDLLQSEEIKGIYLGEETAPEG